MAPGIRITDTELIFTEFPSKEIGLSRFCASFNINLDDIRLIGISPRFSLDEESIFILIIDKSNKLYPMPEKLIGSKCLIEFEKYFDLEALIDEWGKFEYIDHYGHVDKVVYPKENYWMDLFEKDWKFKIRRLFSWSQPKSFYGNLNKKILKTTSDIDQSI